MSLLWIPTQICPILTCYSATAVLKDVGRTLFAVFMTPNPLLTRSGTWERLSEWCSHSFLPWMRTGEEYPKQSLLSFWSKILVSSYGGDSVPVPTLLTEPARASEFWVDSLWSHSLGFSILLPHLTVAQIHVQPTFLLGRPHCRLIWINIALPAPISTGWQLFSFSKHKTFNLACIYLCVVTYVEIRGQPVTTCVLALWQTPLTAEPSYQRLSDNYFLR